MFFSLESQSLISSFLEGTAYYPDVCFYEICRSLVTLQLTNGFKIKQAVEIQ